MKKFLIFFIVSFLAYLIATLIAVTGFSLWAVFEATAHYFEILKAQGI